MRRDFFKEKGIELVGVNENLVDTIWGEKRPAFPSGKVFVLETKYTGETV